MLRKIGKRSLQATALIGVGGTSFVYYQYPELRKDPLQLYYAAIRGIRTATAATMMAYDYLSVGEENITSETHYKAANRMYKCFCTNGGSYIKLG
jgi:predicted unusual protein kinase regulating ubiquinone biosynthesis (AarF/ABC1/UbiB family)